jgi:hypothetical protein
MLTVTFKRPFVLFSYNLSHSLLLLRSSKSPVCSKRIDVLFQDVRAIECRTDFPDLVIEEVGPEFLNDVRSKAKEVIEPGHRVYSLKSGNWIGFVVGGIVSHHEDEAEFFAPSSLLPSSS